MSIKLYRASQKIERQAPNIAKRIKDQVEMRKSGMSFKDIASAFHMSENYVRRCVNNAIKDGDKNG